MYTLLFCAGCRSRCGLDVREALASVVRRTPHAVMVLTDCQLRGPAACGGAVVVQPCSLERVPTAPAVVVGPIRTAADLAAVTAWLDRGSLNAALLPGRLVRQPVARCAHPSLN